jgi:DNA repair exonuclease SbcCD ATPase subunit
MLDETLKTIAALTADRDAQAATTADVDQARRDVDQAQAILDRVKGHDPAAGCVLDRQIPCLTKAADFKARAKAASTALKAAGQVLADAARAKDAAQELTGQIREAERMRTYHQTQLQKWADANAAAVEAGMLIQRLTDELATFPDLATLGADQDRIDQERDALDRQIQAAIAYQAQTTGRGDLLAKKADLEATVVRLDTLAERLGPKGVRVRALQAAIDDFEGMVNAALADIGFSVDLNFDPWQISVQTSPDGPTRPFMLLSDGEKLMVGAAFQTALAAITGLDLVVVDAVETTVGVLRAAITNTLMVSPVGQVIVAVAKAPDDPVPSGLDDLQIIGLSMLPVGA